jgi:hypothetical protein
MSMGHVAPGIGNTCEAGREGSKKWAKAGGSFIFGKILLYYGYLLEPKVRNLVN